jgi:hypothetical protein
MATCQTHNRSAIDRIREPPRYNRAHHIACVEVVRKPEFNPAHRIKPFDLRRIQAKVDARQIILELLYPSGSDNRNDRDRLLPEPRKRNLRR